MLKVEKIKSWRYKNWKLWSYKRFSSGDNVTLLTVISINNIIYFNENIFTLERGIYVILWRFSQKNWSGEDRRY